MPDHAPRCLSRYPGYDVLAKRRTPVLERADARGGHAGSRSAASRASSPRRNCRPSAAIAARIVPQPRDRPPIPVAALVDEKLDARRGGRLPACRECRASGEAWRRGLAALDAEAQRSLRRRFTASRRRSGRPVGADAERRTQDPGLGRHALRNTSSSSAWRTTSSMPITRIPPRGARSAGAARPARAAMSGWISTNATPGKRPRRRTATSTAARRKNRHVR